MNTFLYEITNKQSLDEHINDFKERIQEQALFGNIHAKINYFVENGTHLIKVVSNISQEATMQNLGDYLRCLKLYTIRNEDLRLYSSNK